MTTTTINNIKSKGTHNNGNSKKVFDVNTKVVYSSMSDAAEALGVSISTVSLCIRGKNKTCAGHQLRLVQDAETFVDVLFEAVERDATDMNSMATALQEAENTVAVKETENTALQEALIQSVAETNRLRQALNDLLAAQKHLAEMQVVCENILKGDA